MKIAIIIMILAMVIVGCAPGQGPVQFQVDPDSQEVIAKIAARHVADEIQKRYPAVAAEVLALSKKILIADESIVEIMIDQLIFVLTKEIKDDLIAMDIKDIVGLIKIKSDAEITPEQKRIIKSIVSGFIQGFER